MPVVQDRVQACGGCDVTVSHAAHGEAVLLTPPSRRFIPPCAGAPSLNFPHTTRHSVVNDSSVIVVQIFDQKKFKRKDQGFLGVINIKVSQVLDLDLGGEGA